jgi:hypothetical protein
MVNNEVQFLVHHDFKIAYEPKSLLKKHLLNLDILHHVLNVYQLNLLYHYNAMQMHNVLHRQNQDLTIYI